MAYLFFGSGGGHTWNGKEGLSPLDGCLYVLDSSKNNQYNCSNSIIFAHDGMPCITLDRNTLGRIADSSLINDAYMTIRVPAPTRIDLYSGITSFKTRDIVDDYLLDQDSNDGIPGDIYRGVHGNSLDENYYYGSSEHYVIEGADENGDPLYSMHPVSWIVKMDALIVQHDGGGSKRLSRYPAPIVAAHGDDFHNLTLAEVPKPSLFIVPFSKTEELTYINPYYSSVPADAIGVGEWNRHCTVNITTMLQKLVSMSGDFAEIGFTIGCNLELEKEELTYTECEWIRDAAVTTYTGTPLFETTADVPWSDQEAFGNPDPPAVRDVYTEWAGVTGTPRTFTATKNTVLYTWNGGFNLGFMGNVYANISGLNNGKVLEIPYHGVNMGEKYD